MRPQRAAWIAAVAVTSIVLGFLAAAQLRAQLLTPTDRVGRSTALVNTVQDLEAQNASGRGRVAGLRAQVDGLEVDAARRSAATAALEQQVAGLRAHAGLTPMRGPGVTVTLDNGRPATGPGSSTDHLVGFADVQDVVNTLFAGGAEGVAVNGHRVSPATAFQGSAGTVVVDQGTPVRAPFRVTAVGDRAGMEQVLADPSSLGDVRERARRLGVRLDWSGAPDLSLPAYDSAFAVGDAKPA